MMRIDHCVCTGLTFADLISKATAEQLSFEQLAERTGATRGCAMCRPYVCRALRTGETVFHEVLPPEPVSER